MARHRNTSLKTQSIIWVHSTHSATLQCLPLPCKILHALGRAMNQALSAMDKITHVVVEVADLATTAIRYCIHHTIHTICILYLRRGSHCHIHTYTAHRQLSIPSQVSVPAEVTHKELPFRRIFLQACQSSPGNAELVSKLPPPGTYRQPEWLYNESSRRFFGGGALGVMEVMELWS